MKTLALRWIGPAVVLVGSLCGLGGPTAQAQFGFSYNSPGLSIGVGQPAFYGGYYPPPVVVPRPIVVAPPVIYGPRPGYYGGGYGYRGGYGPRPGYYGGGHGGYGYPHRY